ncbi:MAG: hypothetical protein Sapg2KO_09460 [Saprospiraceae bacterium]
MPRSLVVLLFVSFSAFNLYGLNAEIGTLHALVLVDEYSEISTACIADKFKIEEEVQIIAQKTRMQLNLQQIDYSKDGLERSIEALEVGENDVIFFYFTGHGYRYENQITCGDLPYLYLTKAQEHLYEAGICLDAITEQLKAKAPRLLVSLADCCNNILPYEEPVAMNTALVGEVYKKLFLQTEGHIIATSSLPGQFSFATNNGGYFTNGFLATIRDLASLESDLNQITWEKVLKRTTALTIINSESKQKPQYQIEVNAIEEKAIPGMVILPGNN